MAAHIRERTPADLDACVAILREVHDDSGYPIRWPEDPVAWLTAPTMPWTAVAEVDGRVVGHVAMRESPRDGDVELSRLFVAPSARGKGIGAALFDAAVAWADSQSVDFAIHVSTTDTAAIALYERRGWAKTDELHRDWTHPNGTPVVFHRYERLTS